MRVSRLNAPSQSIIQEALLIVGDAKVNILSRNADEILAYRSTHLQTAREKAIRIHRFVSTEIRFGFTPMFDWASPEYTLENRLGHCNPQSSLFVALCNAAGVEARAHYVKISNSVLSGFGSFPSLLTHSFSEVNLDGKWVRTDSYIVDPRLFEAATRRLEEEGKRLGYGVHVEGTIEWDGVKDAFSQMIDPPLSEICTTIDPYQEVPSQTNFLVRWAIGAGFFIDSSNDVIQTIRINK